MKKTRKTSLMLSAAVLSFATAVGVLVGMLPRVSSTVASADTSVKASIVNLDGNGGEKTYFVDSLQGAQNEYVYFGTNTTANGNTHTGAIKWRVLSKSDTKYSNGEMLLWADYQIGKNAYNPKYDQPNYAYWSTSQMRATLNGGNYPNTVSGTTMPSLSNSIAESDSYYGTVFTTDEKSSVVASGTYTTDNWGLDTTKSQYLYSRDGITSSGYGTNGKYNSSIIGTGTASSASVTAANGVQETSGGDKLFLLDYYDINDLGYGFSDNGQNYATKVNSSWTPSSNWYPGYYDGAGKNFNNITSDYLSFSGDLEEYYWLRPAGRYNTTNSLALLVASSGNLGIHYVSYANGVRPAFNFNPESVIYATAASVAYNGATFAAVDTLDNNTSVNGKPAYKVYTKSAGGYVNYNSAPSGAPKLSLSTNSVTVTKDGQTGKAVILLADKEDAGNVKYQATTTFSGGSATATLPSGVKAGDYAVTVLFLDEVKGEQYAESVKASFTQSGIVPPEDYEETYSGDCQWDDELDSDGYSVLKIMYTSPLKDATAEDKTSAGTAGIVNAGKYVLTLKLADGQIWTDGTTANKTLNITVKQKEITPFNPTIEYGKNEDNSTKEYFEGTGTSGFPTIKPPTAWDGKGTLKWDDNQTLSTTNTDGYKWTFTPSGDDEINYAVKKGTSNITVKAISIKSITATLTGTGDIYTSTKLEDLLKRMQVTATNNDGTDGGTVATDKLQFKAGTSLTAGENVKLTIQLKSDTSVTCDITIPKILAVKPAELVITHDGSTVYTTTSIDDLKGQLTVKIKNNDGSEGKTLSATEYSFPDGFELTDGSNDIELSYKFGTAPDEETVTGKVTINVGNAAVKSVSVTVSVPSGTTLWEDAAANTIKQYLTVTVVFDDGNDTTKTLSSTDNYTVTVEKSDKNVLTAGTCVFTVTYGGKSSNKAFVTVTEILVTELEVIYAQTDTIYSTASASDVVDAGVLAVNATFNNGKKSALSDDEYTLSLQENFSSTNNTVTVTWTKGTNKKEKTFTVTVTDRDISGMTATYTVPDGFRLDASKGLDDLKAGIVAELTFNDGGDPQKLKPEQYTLEAADGVLFGEGENKKLTAGTHTITIKFGDKASATFTVTVEKAEVNMEDITFTPSDDTGEGLEPDGNGGFKGTYKPDGDFGIGIDPDSLPVGVTVKDGYPKYQVWTGKGEPTFGSDGKPTGSGWTSLPAGAKPTGAGTYYAEVDFDYDEDNFDGIKPVSTVVTVGKGTHDTGSTGVKPSGSNSGLKPSDNGGYAGTYTPEGNYGIEIDPDTLPEGVTAEAPVYKKLKDGGDPDNENDWEVVAKPDGAGTYKVVVELTSDDPDNYNEIDPIETVLVLSEAKKGLDLPTIEDIVFSNALVSIADKLGGSYLDHKDIITLGGVYDGVKNAGVYTATLTLTDDNYYWNESAGTGTQTNGKKVLFAGGSYTVNGQVATLTWRITPYILTAKNWALTGKNGAVYNLPSELTEGLDVGVNYRYFEDKASEAMEDGAALSEGAQYFVKAELYGTDAYNFVFEGTLTATSEFADYTTPAGFLTNAVNFLKANWLWLVIAAVVLIALILAIVLGTRSAKKKKLLAEKKEEERLAREERKEEERRQREEERRREEREERMMRMNQQQAMPQMQMPQMPSMMPQMMAMQMPQAQPQYAPQPQPQPQYAPQAQPVAAGGGSGEIAELKAEIAALKSAQDMAVLKAEATMRAEQATRELAEQRIAQSRLEMQVATMAAHMGGETVVQSGVPMDRLTEIIRTEVNNALAAKAQPVAQSAPAAPENGNANVAPATQVPPDAVMTTVTTTKIDTTKKPVQNAQARPVVRSYVAPMPVDDGRVFDVGGFYKPADPLTDFADDGEEDKK